ncbi:MAG: threonine/homoserine/homoserine lactone efflux protein [Gammaproteobacteria bacterium]|jgi:threonine/homoserine/homoserine lactone efflux protein
MEIEAWLALATVHLLGAASPGPSLAVVLRNTLVGGARLGVITGAGHGLGFGIYALLVASGLATALNAHSTIERWLQWGGTAILLYLGYQFIRHSLSGPYQLGTTAAAGHADSNRSGFAQGFLVAILNPKILAWMLAIYAPFIHAGLQTHTIFAIVLMGALIDGLWYVMVAVVLARGNRIATLRSVAHRIDAAMGVLMLIFAAVLLTSALQ